MQAVGSGLEQGRRNAAAEPAAQTRGAALIQPGPGSLGVVLTKHSAILQVCWVCTRRRSSFHLRNSAAARRASAEACRRAEAGRWHHGLGKETWRPPPLGFVPGVIPPFGSWDMPWPKHVGVSSLHHCLALKSVPWPRSAFGHSCERRAGAGPFALCPSSVSCCCPPQSW